MDVSDRRLQVRLTLEAKIASDFSLVRAIFAFAGFVSALRLAQQGFLTLFPAREPHRGERETALYTRKRTPQADFFDTLSGGRPPSPAVVFWTASGAPYMDADASRRL